MMHIHKSISLCCLPALLAACSLNIEIEDRAADPHAIVDVTSAQRALATAYADYTSWQTMIELTAMSDDVMPTPFLPKRIELFNAYHWRTEQLILLSEEIWKSDYSTIMHVNALLERIGSISPATDKERSQLLTTEQEAKALKAYCMFHLMRVFAPRYTTSVAEKPLGIVNKNSVKLEKPSRMTLAQTADSIRRLLDTYTKEPQVATPPTKFRISSRAAICLRADLELWTGNYEKVIGLCEPEVNAMGDDVFEEKAFHMLWNQGNGLSEDCLYSVDHTSFSGTNFFDTWSSDDGDYLVVNSPIKYDATDIRRESSTIPYNFPVNFGTHYRKVNLLGKYNAIRRQKENIRYISRYRMSDFIFLCAEAYARTGKKEKSIKLMNRYLEKRKAAIIASHLSHEQVIECILSEKQKEFLGEGRRFFELKRLGNQALNRSSLFDDETGGVISPNDFRWTFPIPASEYRYNPNVGQNEGWEKYMPKNQY